MCGNSVPTTQLATSGNRLHVKFVSDAQSSGTVWIHPILVFNFDFNFQLNSGIPIEIPRSWYELRRSHYAHYRRSWGDDWITKSTFTGTSQRRMRMDHPGTCRSFGSIRFHRSVGCQRPIRLPICSCRSARWWHSVSSSHRSLLRIQSARITFQYPGQQFTRSIFQFRPKSRHWIPGQGINWYSIPLYNLFGV